MTLTARFTANLDRLSQLQVVAELEGSLSDEGDYAGAVLALRAMRVHVQNGLVLYSDLMSDLDAILRLIDSR